jgi:hypothetical protein
MIGTDSVGLLFRIKGDGSHAKKEIKEVNQEAGKLDDAGDKSKLTSFLTSVSQSLAGMNFGSASEGATNLTSKVGGISQSLSGLAGPASVGIGAILAGFTAAIGLAVALGAALFNLAKQASDFGSEIFDASEKTGLSAETLSALKVAAEQSGASFQLLSNGIVKFTLLIGEAAQGSEDAKDKLTRLGIDPQEAINDLEGAFAKALARIAAIENPIAQATAASDAFGSKLGKELIPVIQSFDGDVEQLKKDMAALGLTITDEAAQASDEFGDSLDTLQKQAKSATFTLGKELMPAFTQLFRVMSQGVAENKNSIGAFADFATKNIKLLMLLLGDFVIRVQMTAETIDAIASRENVLEKLEQIGQRAQAKITQNKAVFTGDVVSGTSGLTQTKEDFDFDTGKAAEERQKKREQAFQKELASRQKQNQLLLKVERDNFADVQKQNEQNFIDQKLTAEQFRDGSLKLFEDYQKRVKELLENSFNLDKTGKSATDLKNLQIGLASDISALDREMAQEKSDLEKLITDTKKKELDKRVTDEKDSINQIIANNQAKLAEYSGLAALTIERFTKDFEAGLLSETELISRIFRERKFLVDEEILQKRKLLAQYKETSNEYKNLLAEIQKLEASRSEQERENGQKIVDLIREQGAALLEKERIELEIEERKKLRMLAEPPSTNPNEGLDRALGIQNETSDRYGGGLIGELAGAIAVMSDETVSAADKMNTALTGISANWDSLRTTAGFAINSMLQGIGSMVQSWVLLGSSGGQSLRKFTAQVLAAVAAQAAVLAIFELAKGFAALFFNPPEAAAHFKAAALFGSIAVVAAVTGRAFAGDSFNQKGAVSSGVASGVSNSDSGSSREPNKLEENRLQRQEVIHRVILVPERGFIAQAIVEDYRNRGVTHDLLIQLAEG